MAPVVVGFVLHNFMPKPALAKPVNAFTFPCNGCPVGSTVRCNMTKLRPTSRLSITLPRYIRRKNRLLEKDRRWWFSRKQISIRRMWPRSARPLACLRMPAHSCKSTLGRGALTLESMTRKGKQRWTPNGLAPQRLMQRSNWPPARIPPPTSERSSLPRTCWTQESATHHEPELPGVRLTKVRGRRQRLR